MFCARRAAAAHDVPSLTRSRRSSAIASRAYTPRRLSYAALLVAAGLSGAYAESIPNFEVLTLTAFVSGLLLGARDGATVGGACMLLYSLLNPYGPAHPLVTAAQVGGEAAAGMAGGAVRGMHLERRPAALRVAVMASCALVLTLFFDLITNLAGGWIYGQMRIMLLAGIPLSLWHVATNLALFVALGAPLLGVVARYAARLS